MKTLACTLCLLLGFTSFGQLSIDSIKSAEDVKKFLSVYGKQNGLDWKGISAGDYVADTTNYFSKIKKSLDSSNNRSWMTEDFNNDNKKDLIFNSIINDQRYLFSICSNKDSGYCYVNLLRERFKYSPIDIGVLKEDKTTFLLLHIRGSLNQTKKDLQIIYSDTLVAVFDGFVEKVKKTKTLTLFDTLEFSYFPNRMFLWGAPIPGGFTITLTSAKNKFKYEEFGNLNFPTEQEIEQGLSRDLNVETFFQSNEIAREIKELLPMFDSKAKKFPSTLYIDHPDKTLIKIKYRSHIVRTIEDDLQDSYWVRLLTKKMFAISKRLRTDMAKYFQKSNFNDLEK